MKTFVYRSVGMKFNDQPPPGPKTSARRLPSGFLCARVGRLPSLRVIIQRNANSASVMSVILADDLLAVYLPQPSVVIRARRHQVCRIGTERTVPYPPLVSRKRCLERKWFRVLFPFVAGLGIVDLPNLGCVVGTTSSQFLHVW